ncbi:MAG: choice-of-anchor J domain-containing protein [Bacteroidota bacterium]|nr:choice-of-anchor J domain-containing protein [Bacteroidota bacterium]
MKKLLTLLFGAFAVTSVQAQTVYYSADFNSGTIGSAPNGFTVVNNDACANNDPASFPNGTWVVYDNLEGDTCAAAESWSGASTPSCTVDDWLITPAIDLSGTGVPKLKFRAQSAQGVGAVDASGNPAEFPESYDVLISTTGNNAPADFTVTALSVAAENDAWTAREVDLTAYTGQTIYIAFRLTSTDAVRLYVDDLSVEEADPYDLQLISFQSDATPQVTALNANTVYSVLDYSGTSLFNASVTVENTGQNPVDSVSVNYFIVDDINAPTVGSTVTKDFALSPALAVGAQTTLTLDPIGLDTLFPTLATNEALDIYIELDSTQFNPSVTEDDAFFSFLINPREAYTVPYSSSFEWVVGGTAFSFEHADWGWKFIDANADGDGSYVAGFSNFTSYDGDFHVYSSLLLPNTITNGDAGDYFETPELSLNAGDYVISLYGKPFGTSAGQIISGTLTVELVSGTGATSPIGTFSTGQDTTNWNPNSGVVTVPSSANDWKIRFTSPGGGFGSWDLMSLDQLSAPVASGAIAGTDETNPFVEYCDGNVILSNTSTANGGTCTVDWGDGSSTATIASGATLQHNYSSNGTYTITLTATNPAGSDQATFDILVTDPPALDASFIVVDQGSGNVSITLENTFPCGGAQTTVSWGDGTANNLTSHTYTADGDYTITVTLQTATDIAQSTGSVTITGLSTAIGELSLEDAMTVVPSPAVSDVNVSFSLFSVQDVTMTISTIEGRVVESRIIESAKTVNEAFDVRSLDNGIYMINVSTETGSTSSSFVVSH